MSDSPSRVQRPKKGDGAAPQASLAELRAAYAEAAAVDEVAASARSAGDGPSGPSADDPSDRAIREFIDSVDGDIRVGARQLAERGERLLIARQAERDRMAQLLALRNSLAAEGTVGIAGIDEVGVGPLAGSVVAAAVILPERVTLRGIDDSKRVPAARRVILAGRIREIAVGVGLGEVGPEEIDQLGIFQASLEAMRRSVASLARTTEVGHLLVDARTVPGVTLPQTPIVKGDQKDASIAAASIVAKVYRDEQMSRLARRYPAYGFDRHMGYGTAEHLAALDEFGPCPVHRRSFAPVERAERKHAAGVREGDRRERPKMSSSHPESRS